MQFTQLDLHPNLLNALNEMGYDTMTPIQEKAIPLILEGRDVLGLAETGSGKTGACGVPLIQRTEPELNAIQALVLVPTRELALQYVQEVERLAQGTGVIPFAIYGGVSMGAQKAKLNHKVHILVATPGRLLDFIWNTDLNLSRVRTLVLDEADEMLKMGFIQDVELIMSCLVHDHQKLLFSATMPREIYRLTKAHLNKPARIELNKKQKAPQSLQHFFQHTGRNRLPALLEYLEREDIQQGIIFCNSRHQGASLLRELLGRLSSVEFMHGGLDQDRRTYIFNQFRDKKIKLMIATDVAARGLDFTHVSHVINYDAPPSHEVYTHRTGRAGRMGRIGTAMTLVTDRDLKNIKKLFQANRIDPQWHGEAPEFTLPAKKKTRNRPQKRGGAARKRAPRKNSSRRWTRSSSSPPTSSP